MIERAGPAHDTGVPALVLNLDANPFHHGALGAVRSLGRVGVPVWAVLAVDGPLTASRYLSGWAHWDATVCTDGEVVTGLRWLAARLGPCVPIPVDDRSAALLAQRAADLGPELLLPAVPSDLPRRFADKAGLTSLCAAHDVPTPVTQAASTEHDVRAFLATVGRPPYVVKVATPWAGEPPAGMPRTAVVNDPDDLQARVAAAPGRLVLQQYLPGEPADPVSHAYIDAAGSAVVAATGRKLRAYPRGVGLTAAGRTEDIPDVLAASLRLLAATGYRGPVDMDWRRDADGRALLLDVNPRQGAQFRLFERVDGVDLARALHLDVTGRTVGTAARLEPKVFRVEQYEIAVAPHYVRRGGVRALRSGPGVVEWAWWAPDDPRPLAVLAAAYARKALRKPAAPGPRSPVLHDGRAVRR